jgi:hypothetical protein
VPSNNSSGVDVTVNEVADLTVSVGVSTTTPLGLTVNFAAFVENQGPGQAQDVAATVLIPYGYEVKLASSTDGTVSVSGGTITVTVPSIDAGNTVTINGTLQAQVVAPSTITASASSIIGDPNASNNSSSVTLTAVPDVIPNRSNDFSAALPPSDIIPLGFGTGSTDFFYDEASGAYVASIQPAANIYNGAGFISEGAASIPYSAVGADRFVRGKFSVYQSDVNGNVGFTSPDTTPELRLRLSNRFAVTKFLEVNSHVEGDTSGSVYAAELTPSGDPANPSIYRVDYDPIDVPYLTANPSEGIRYGFEAIKASNATEGILYLTDISLGTYSKYVTSGTAPVQTYLPEVDGPGGLGIDLPNAFLRSFTFQLDSGFNIINFDDPGNPEPVYTDGSFGITLDTRNVTSDTIAIITREIATPQNDIRARISENKLYKVRFNLSSTQNTANQASIRVRARTVKFGYAESLLLGGAWATGTDSTVGNAAIAQQSLPGVGTQNPDRRPGQTNGGWYSILLNSPLSRDIRADVAGTITDRFPLLANEPGFGSTADSFRDLKVGIDIIDTLSFGPNAAQEEGLVTLDAVEVYEYDQIPD